MLSLLVILSGPIELVTRPLGDALVVRQELTLIHVHY